MSGVGGESETKARSGRCRSRGSDREETETDAGRLPSGMARAVRMPDRERQRRMAVARAEWPTRVRKTDAADGRLSLARSGRRE
ncbi:hypothetical protein QJS04_geneDACA000088 [Acorus gramineus]|uniref:Uncharacterized protein n=1 Tax=Acorus gramineus TaxID=55184 RepID=A0AAV9AR90_ACOGR|nr:hypothetical protein QJS04_geneDACA000088 [Acorus gramineus]